MTFMIIFEIISIGFKENLATGPHSVGSMIDYLNCDKVFLGNIDLLLIAGIFCCVS